MPLSLGESAPFFTAPTPSSPEFVLDAAAGRFVLMLFLPLEPEAAGAALQTLAAHQSLFDDAKLSAFVVLRDREAAKGAQARTGIRWIFDDSGRITQRYGPQPHWLLLDPTLRALGAASIEAPEGLMALIQRLPTPGAHAGTPLVAPVLTAPRIFEPELCQALIGLHAADGGVFTGVMRDAGDRTIAVMDDLKKRRDVIVDDPELIAAITERLERRLYPFIKLALGFSVTHIERYLVSCYDAADDGVFHPHRDNTTQGTAHRKFGCSLNLNNDFEGGDLRFAEYGATTYRPPLGGAVVFACGLMHEALRVTRGRRYAFLPFFHDQEGADTLAAYRARTAATPEPVP